jgi:hypothetical protein
MNKELFASLVAVSLSLFAIEVPALADTDLVATLSGDTETPPVTTIASGSGEFTVDDDSTGVIYSVNLSDIDDITAAHIHVGAVGVAGPIVLTVPEDNLGNSMSGTLGTPNFTPQPAQGINTVADAINAIRNGNAYFNVHTDQNPNGEVRGQMVVKP